MPLDASIVITSYNVERYLVRAVESALAQASVNVEVILVDDCSTDGTWNLIQTFTDPRIRSFQLAANAGPGAARNKGFAEAKGEWIVVLDGDDVMEPTRISTCIARARAANADVVVDNLLVCREEDGASFPMFTAKHFSALDRLTLPTFIKGKVSRRDKHSLGYLKPIFAAAFLRKHGLHYQAELRIGEDYIMLAEALALGAVCAVEPDAGYRYTVRAGSISHRLSLEHIERMQAADAQFVAKYALDAAAMKELAKRARLLAEMKAYNRLVTALKEKSAARALAVVAQHPKAARHLWEPVWKRLRKLGGDLRVHGFLKLLA